MTLNQLKYFQAVCKYSSISKASAVLHISQPAISVAINNLEEEFGVVLFDRENRVLEITEAGSLLLQLTNELLAHVGSIYEQMSEMASGTSQLRLSVVPFAYSSSLQAILNAFRDAAPGTQIRVYESNAQNAIQKIKSNQTDVALTVETNVKPPFVDGYRLFTAPAVFVVGENHPMAGLKRCRFEDLENQSLIVAREDSYLTGEILRRFKERGISPNIYFYTAQVSLMNSMLQSGHHGAIISTNLAANIPNIVCIPIEDTIEITHVMLWKKTSQLPLPLKRFIREMRKLYPQAEPY